MVSLREIAFKMDVYVAVADNLLCKNSIIGLAVFMKAKNIYSIPFVTLKCLLLKYRHNDHIICSKEDFFA